MFPVVGLKNVKVISGFQYKFLKAINISIIIIYRKTQKRWILCYTIVLFFVKKSIAALFLWQLSLKSLPLHLYIKGIKDYVMYFTY